MTGYLTPTTGNVYVNDLDIQSNTLEIQKQIEYLPELNPLYSEMRVYDLLEFTGNIRNITGKAFKNSLARVVEQCGLKGVIHRMVSECSKGYKQRIGLACAMIHDPKILILDEPVTGLDPNQIVEIRNLIKDLGTEKLVLMSSHILQEIQATVNRIIIIHKGKIVADGTNEELMSGFMGNTKLTLEIKNAEDSTVKALTEKIPSISLVDTTTRNGSQILHLEYSKEKDPREELFQYAIDSNWVVIEMNPHSVNLESIFRTLTMEDKTNA
jgi:ABC-2 type transport system ATP-binding protein